MAQDQEVYKEQLEFPGQSGLPVRQERLELPAQKVPSDLRDTAAQPDRRALQVQPVRQEVREELALPVLLEPPEHPELVGLQVVPESLVPRVQQDRLDYSVLLVS